MTEPKYKVGDILSHVAYAGMTAMVVEIIQHTCPGGTQTHYRCRVSDYKGTVGFEYRDFNEIELVRESSQDAFERALGAIEFEKRKAVVNGHVDLAAQLLTVVDAGLAVKWDGFT